MNAKEIKEEFIRHKSRIKDTYDRDMEALYRLYPDFRPDDDLANTNGGERGKLARLVRKAYTAHEKPLTL